MTQSPSQSTDYYRRLAAGAGLRFVRLDPAARSDPDHQPVNPLAARLLPETLCQELRILAVAYREGVVTVATSNPHALTGARRAAAMAGREVHMILAPPGDIDRVIDQVFGVPPPSAPRRGVPSEPPLEPETSRPPSSRSARRAHLGTLLVDRGLITEAALEQALGAQERSNARLGEILVARGAIGEEELIAVLAEQLDMPLVDLAGYEPEPEALGAIPAAVARNLHCVPLAIDDETLYVAASEVLGDRSRASLARHVTLGLQVFLATPSSIAVLLDRVYGRSSLPDPVPGPVRRLFASRAQARPDPGQARPAARRRWSPWRR